MFVDPKYKQMQYKSDKYSRREESDTASERTLKGQDQKSRRGQQRAEAAKDKGWIFQGGHGRLFLTPQFQPRNISSELLASRTVRK